MVKMCAPGIRRQQDQWPCLRAASPAWLSVNSERRFVPQRGVGIRSVFAFTLILSHETQHMVNQGRRARPTVTAVYIQWLYNVLLLLQPRITYNFRAYIIKFHNTLLREARQSSACSVLSPSSIIYMPRACSFWGCFYFLLKLYVCVYS